MGSRYSRASKEVVRGLNTKVMTSVNPPPHEHIPNSKYEMEQAYILILITSFHPSHPSPWAWISSEPPPALHQTGQSSR